MISNYIKVAVRNILRHKGYSFINVIGLAIGMTCCLLTMLWVMDELSYDRFHENAPNIYRVEQDQNYSGRLYHVNVTPYPMAEGILAEIPEAENATPYPWYRTMLFRYGEKAFFESGVRAVEPGFLRMFSYPLIRGDAPTALENPHSVIITEDMAEKYFGEEDPLNKVMQLNNEYDFTVTGILKNPPSNSILQFDMLIPFKFLPELGQTIDQWGWNSIVTYVQLHENANVAEVNEKITDLRFRKVEELLQDNPEDLQRYREAPRTQFMLRPLTDIHLHAYFGYTKSMGDILYVYIVSVIAAFVLLIACINFMNLSTARSANRAKEVGMRKVVGAQKTHLVGQFYGESILMAFAGLLIALCFVMLVLPHFGNFVDKQFTLASLFRWQFIVGMLAVTLVTGLVSGSYPALFLSSFLPVQVLRGSLSSGAKSSLFRKVLVVTQFTLSISLIIGTVVIYNQITFMKHKELGYDREHMMYIPLRGDTRESYEVLKNELLKGPEVLNVTGTNHTPSHIGSNSSGGDWDGKDPESHVLISFNAVDFEYIETMKIDLVEGRSFSKEFTTDTATAFMVNEEVVKIMGVESAVDKRFEFLGTDGKIIGVMKNYHFQSVQEKIEPLAIYARPEQVNYVVIRLREGDIEKGVDYVRAAWEQVVPDYPFDYRFVDEDLDRQYRGWQQLSDLLKYFAFLAIFIACLGLFGLALFTAEQRTKEIGVRKVLGASLANLLFLLSKEFTKWVILANVIAWPVAYFVMNNWLQGFAYRTSLAWWIFVSSGVLALVIAIITVSYQCIRAALINPAEALKYE